MTLKDTILTNWNNFALDTGAIQMQSAAKNFVLLPYIGELPESLNEATNARICFNVQPTRQPSAILNVTDATGEERRYLLNAKYNEIAVLLGQFFGVYGDGRNEDSGLDPYWLGFWQANYIAWNRIIDNPSVAVDIVNMYPTDDRLTAVHRINRSCKKVERA